MSRCDYDLESRVGSIAGSVRPICKTLLSRWARWNAKRTDHVKEAEWNKQTRRSKGGEAAAARRGRTTGRRTRRGGRRGQPEEERRRRYRRTLEEQRGSGLRIVERAGGGGPRRDRGWQRNGRVLLGVERGEREGKS